MLQGNTNVHIYLTFVDYLDSNHQKLGRPFIGLQGSD